MLTIVVGGQFGGEGKGKVAAYLAKRWNISAVSRGGGVNSSHTVQERGVTHRLRLMPTACVSTSPKQVLFGAGTLLHLPTLFQEMESLGVPRESVMIDPQAGIVSDECISDQREDGRYAAIGSTLTGTGYASAERCRRRLPLAREVPALRAFLGDVPMRLAETLGREEGVLVEGHQGFGLSNYHGDYPFCSSRDATTAALLSELGLGPRWPMRVVLVLKVFPTRNHPGRLPNEMTAEEASALGIEEVGGGAWGIADRRRRVGRVDLSEVRRAVLMNSATEIALTGADYLEPGLRGKADARRLGAALDFVRALEAAAGVPVRYVSTGPETDSMIELDDDGRIACGLAKSKIPVQIGPASAEHRLPSSG